MRTQHGTHRLSRLTCRVAFALAVGVQLVVLYLPRIPDGASVDVPGADKAVHLLVFAAVMVTGTLAGIRPLWLAVALAGHAVISEVIQHLALPDRSGDVADVLANLAGIAIGAYLLSVLRRHRLGTPAPRRHSPPNDS